MKVVNFRDELVATLRMEMALRDPVLRRFHGTRRLLAQWAADELNVADGTELMRKYGNDDFVVPDGRVLH